MKLPNVEESTGTLRYSIGDEGFKLIVEVDLEIARLYRSLIPKHYQAQPPRYPPHITVVRKEGPHRDWGQLWGKYEGDPVTFTYSVAALYGDVYIWLMAWCPRLVEIRKELGLPESTIYTRPPDGDDCFHITIANRKGVVTT